MICPTAKAKYFCEKGWTGILQNCPTGKSVGWSSLGNHPANPVA
jgi:hypothetical protein